MQHRHPHQRAHTRREPPKRLGADRTLALELDVCAAYRIPHSEFLRWSADDRDKAIWHHLWKRQTCPNCDTRRDEWDESRGGHRHAYAGEKRRCRGCEVKAATQASIVPEDGEGVYVVLVPNEEVRRANA
ncbi:hypothetical protein [Nonomuraea sp. CA-141351]|uniref:hypothetical protein n=1 Tax=Nonomuraea sp. CA-141351 TaxID=3239996 RepID=UPI003D8A3907